MICTCISSRVWLLLNWVLSSLAGPGHINVLKWTFKCLKMDFTLFIIDKSQSAKSYFRVRRYDPFPSYIAFSALFQLKLNYCIFA